MSRPELVFTCAIAASRDRRRTVFRFWKLRTYTSAPSVCRLLPFFYSFFFSSFFLFFSFLFFSLILFLPRFLSVSSISSPLSSLHFLVFPHFLILPPTLLFSFLCPLLDLFFSSFSSLHFFCLSSRGPSPPSLVIFFFAIISSSHRRCGTSLVWISFFLFSFLLLILLFSSIFSLLPLCCFCVCLILIRRCFPHILFLFRTCCLLSQLEGKYIKIFFFHFVPLAFYLCMFQCRNCLTRISRFFLLSTLLSLVFDRRRL